MLSYDCIIVEDEPLAIEMLKDYIGMVPSLHLIQICTDAIQALDVVRQHKIDLIFLDIHLPELKGMDFMKTLPQCPPVIITSAYHQYALPSYEYNVVDYLLKPFDFARFVKAINKFSQQTSQVGMVASGITEKPFIVVSVNKKKQKVFTGDILYVESLREYVKIFTASGSITTKVKIGMVGEWLSNKGFMQVHRSFIVSLDKITTFTATYVGVNGKQIPVGRNYKNNVLNGMNAGQIRKKESSARNQESR